MGLGRTRRACSQHSTLSKPRGGLSGVISSPPQMAAAGELWVSPKCNLAGRGETPEPATRAVPAPAPTVFAS